MNRPARTLVTALMMTVLMAAGSANAKKHTDKASKSAKCLLEVGAVFNGEVNSVVVESTKDLSNIVLLFADGTTQRFEDLSGNDGEFAGTAENSGKILTGVWIKSGCNASGDGPGYGEFIENANDTGNTPVISIADAPGIIEPDIFAEVAEAWFEVTLSEMVPLDGDPVIIEYTTRDGTATAFEDYLPDAGTLVFEPGTITQTIVVLVLADQIIEAPEEFFHIDLSNPQNAQIANPTGTGTVIDDDGTDI